MENPVFKKWRSCEVWALASWRQFGFGVVYSELVPFVTRPYAFEILISFLFFKISIRKYGN